MRIAIAAALFGVLTGVIASQDAPEKGVEDPKPAVMSTEVKIDRAQGDKTFQIAGTLDLPTGVKGQVPAVFFVSGSGMQPRTGLSGGIDLGTTELLDRVAKNEFAVLRVDDRGTGETPLGPEGQKPSDLGYDELVGDARACVKWLKDHDRVDADRVFLIGHSEGGLTAAILASEDPSIAGIISMGGMGRNLWGVTIDQVSDAMKNQPKAQREANLKAQKEFMAACKENREPDFTVLGDALAGQLKKVYDAQVKPLREWWHDHFVLDVPAIHAKIACPVFVAQGASDFQVNPTKDARKFAANLMAGAATDVKLKIYEDLDHLFKPCGGKPSTADMYKEKRAVSEAYLTDVVAWLKARA